MCVPKPALPTTARLTNKTSCDEILRNKATIFVILINQNVHASFERRVDWVCVHYHCFGRWLTPQRRVTNLRPLDTQDNPFWYMFKVQCTSCREIHGNFVGVNRFVSCSQTRCCIDANTWSQETNDISGSRGEANFVWKCKNCKVRQALLVVPQI